MRKLLFIITASLLMPIVGRGQASYEWMYWFDSENEVAISGAGGKDLHLELDVGRLAPGVHKMHMMVRDVATDRLCNPTASFFVVPEDIYGRDDIMYYWFDDDDRIIYHHAVVDGPIQLNVDSLPAGIHTFHTQVKNIETGRVCNPNKRFFIVPEKIEDEKDIMYYWYDDDDAVVFHSPVSDGAVFIDVDTLNAGIHSINIQVKNIETGRVCNPSKRFFIVPEKIEDEKDIMYYWYDDDDAVVFHSPVSEGAVFLNVNSLNAGIHTVNIQVKNIETGRVCNPVKRYFIVPERNADEGDVMYYWYDDEPDVINKSFVKEGPVLLDVKEMSTGIHTLHVQIRNNETGRLSIPERRYFIIPDSHSDEDELIYWYDDEKEMTISTPVSNETIMLDVSSLSEGIHSIHFQVKDGETGRLSEITSRFFIVPEKDADEEAMFHYWFDENHADMVSTPVGDGALMLDVASLSEGIHILHSYIKKDGRMSEPKHQAFVKQPIGGNAIAYYSYWLNDADTERSVVKVDEPTNPYELIDMLPVEPQPLRSSSFHFEVTDGQPTMYAKNDIHLTFTDLYGQESKPVSKQFVDVNTSEIVTDIAELQNTQTFARPEANKVKWFSFKAAPKDSVSLKSSQATSIQVFDAVGNELYAADGTASTKFDGCRIAEEGTYYVAVHNVTGTKSDVTLDAQFDRTLFALTYIVDGDTLITESHEYCATIEPLSAPEKEGHTFSGWSEMPETMPAHDVSVTGTFTVNQYRLSFVVDGDTLSSTMVDYGTELKAIDAPVREGETFSGWSTLPKTMPAKDVVIIGTFSTNSYKVTFKVDGEVYEETYVVYGTALTAIDAPTKTGYTFSGWSEMPETMPAEDVEVTGSFTVNQYMLSFVVDGDTLSSKMVDYGTELKAIDAPVREGETFSGWGTLPKTMPAKDVVITGTFSANFYKLIYKVDDELYEESHVAYGSTLTAIDEPTKEGYTFSGWSELPATMPAEDVEVTGTFSANSYKLTYKVDDELYEESHVVYGSTLTAIDEPTKEGYTFSGWSEIPSTMPAHDVSVTGTFTVNQYKLSFVVDGDTLSSAMVDYGTELAAIDAPVREGETFSGWSTLPKTMPAKDVVITGTFSTNSYKVTFKVDGEVYEETYVVYGTALSAIDAPTKTGYTFSGWSEMPETMPAENVVVTGSFTVNQYKVTFIVDGDTLSSTMVDYGTAISVPENPDKEGYTFSGWSPKLDDTVPTHDVSYEATFSINSYTITYMVGDEVVHIETVVFGEKIPEYIYNPEDERYTFTGWAGEIPETMPADNLTFVADILDSIAALKANDDTPVYNINGLKMGVASDLKRLPRGVYIVGGKTIIKK